MRLSTAAAVVAFIVVAVGSVGPWVDTFLGSVGGLHGDGRITLGAVGVGVLALVLAQGRPWGRVVAFLAAAVALGTAGYDFVHIRHEATQVTIFGHQIADVGWGPVAALIGAAAASVAVVADSGPYLRWGTTGLAAGVAVGCLVGGVNQHRPETTAAARSNGPATQTVPAVTQSDTSTTTPPASTTLPEIPAGGGALQIRPGVLDYSADGAAVFAGLGAPGRLPHVHEGQLDWTDWTAHEAIATGGYWRDNCSPNCAGGLYTVYPVSLVAYMPGSVAGHWVFTRLSINFSGALPPGFSEASVTWQVGTDSRGSLYLSPSPPTTQASTLQPPTSPADFVPGDHNLNDANASSCESGTEVGPHSDCALAQHVVQDLSSGLWSPPGSDTVTEGTSAITFNCTVIGTDHRYAAQPGVYTCISRSDSQDWFAFEFT